MPPLDLDRLMLPPEHLATLRSLLAQYTPEADAWAYGSRMNGTAHEGSDLDVVLRHHDNPQWEIPGWLDLKDALQNSMLPMLVEVHVWPQLPPGFQREIERGYGVVREGG
jgi:uncharacterized protein